MSIANSYFLALAPRIQFPAKVHIHTFDLKRKTEQNDFFFMSYYSAENRNLVENEYFLES